MATVVTDIIPDPLTGATFYRVSRVFPNASSAARAVTLLEGVVPEAFVPVVAAPVAQDATPEGEFVFHTQEAAVEFLTERLEATEDDYGAPGEPPRCRAMGSCD